MIRQSRARRFGDIGSWFAIYALSLVAILLTTGLALGFRPVAITTGSMDPWAPTGSLVVAGPSDAESIAVGDVIVMKKPNDVLVTHRVISLQRRRGVLEAVTQGDANIAPDPEPYVIAPSEMTARFALPSAGRLLVALNYRVVLLLVVTGALATLAQTGLRYIWSDEPEESEPDDDNVDGSEPEPVLTPASKAAESRRTKQKISALPVATAILTLLMADTSYALYTATESVSNNTFSTLNCTAADGVTLQSGSVKNGDNGISTVAITAVDPARAFLVFSVSSSRKDPGDQMVRGELTNATTISFERRSGMNNPKAIDIEWSVIEYACGVNVQRGTVSGATGTVVDVPITGASPTTSFALTSLVPTAADDTFGPGEMVQAAVVASDTLRLTSYAFEPGFTYGWQVVTFEEAGVASVQTVSTTLGTGAASATLTLPTAVTTANTFVVASVISNSPGGEVGEQLARISLTSGTTVEVSRLLATDSIDVLVQVVTLNDGTVVTHGITNLGQGAKTATATLPSVDTSIATAMSTVNLPGSMSGGSAVYDRDDIVGEGSATFAVTGATTLSISRDSAKDFASFGWQVIEWAK